MSTVAWDGKVMAADSQCTMGDSKCLDIQKIYRIKDMIVGFSGGWNAITRVRGWIEDGMDPDDRPETNGDVDCLLVIPGRTVMILIDVDDKPVFVENIHNLAAIGTGGGIALGAMMAGANAEKAVDLAKEVDLYSGGKTRVINSENRRKDKWITQSTLRKQSAETKSEHPVEQGAISPPRRARRQRGSFPTLSSGCKATLGSQGS